MVIRKASLPSDSITDRFQGRYTISASGCWEWTAAKNNKGYGQLNVQNKRMLVHRLSYEVHNGPIPDGLVVRHKCDNPSCINPEHLEVGTHKDNMQDMIKRNRGNWKPVKGSAVSVSKLTEDQVIEIRARYVRITCGTTFLAKEYGVSSTVIHNIIRGKAWAWLQ